MDPALGDNPGPQSPNLGRQGGIALTLFFSAAPANVGKRYIDPDLNVVVRVGWAAREDVTFIGRLLPQNCIQFAGQEGVANDTEAVRRRIGP